MTGPYIVTTKRRVSLAGPHHNRGGYELQTLSRRAVATLDEARGLVRLATDAGFEAVELSTWARLAEKGDARVRQRILDAYNARQ